MTDDEAKAIGLRAVAWKGWRWLPGMVPGDATGGHRVAGDSGGGWFCVSHAASESHHHNTLDGSWPDFRDPATLGCLLALVREAWGSWLNARESQALIGSPIYAAHSHRYYATEAEALVAALEAAPTATLDP